MNKTIENAIIALQQVAMAHKSSDEHSREMYRIAEEARSELIAVFKKGDLNI